MFNSESDKVYCNLFCLLVFITVILFLNNNLSLIILAINFYLITNYKNSYVALSLYVLTFIGILCGLFNIFWFFKLTLIIDYIYYFNNNLHIKNIFINNNVNNKIIKKNSLNNNIDIKDEGEINLIDCDLYTNNVALVNSNDEINYFRFKNYSVRKLEKFTFSYANGLYLCFHLFILLISVVLM